jgi:hypothetical protein
MGITLFSDQCASDISRSVIAAGSLPNARSVIAQNHADVDQVLSQSRNTDEITSSGVERARFSWTTFHTMICVLLASSNA